MVDRPERVCLPIEVEPLPLYRDPPGTGRLRREQKREQRRERRSTREAPRVKRLLERIAAGATAVTRRRER
jgi:hypothetical protein